MITYVPDNLWGKVLLSIDNSVLLKDCVEVEKYLAESLPLKEGTGLYGSKTTASFGQYNLMSLPYSSFQNLYHHMVDVIRPCLPDEPHMLQCWLNVFRKGKYQVAWTLAGKISSNSWVLLCQRDPFLYRIHVQGDTR